jgi:hypothetical protein
MTGQDAVAQERPAKLAFPQVEDKPVQPFGKKVNMT